jgi:hypothetical protein
MPVLRKLPSRLKSRVHELSLLRSALHALEEQLALARASVMACGAVPRKELAPVSQALDTAIAHMKGVVSARGEQAQALAQAHFAKQGLAPGAIVALSYPVYGARLDAAFDEERVPRRLSQATLKVEGFTVEHVRSAAEVVLGVSGRLVQDGKPGKDSITCALHPGCELELLRPAPTNEAPGTPAAPESRPAQGRR